MSLSRRSALIAGTAGLSLLFAGGLVWRASSTGVRRIDDDAAYAPWREWANTPLEGPLAAVRAGILAASAHNTQPWLFNVEADRISIHADTTRHLGSVDPFLRELNLSLGCAIANMELAARAAGLGPTIAMMDGRLTDSRLAVDAALQAATVESKSAEVGQPLSMETTLPSVAPRAVARLYLTEAAAERSPLVDAIDGRHTHRGAYDSGLPVPPAVKAAMQAEVGDGLPALKLFLFERGAGQSGAQFERLGKLIVTATRQIVTDPAMSADSARWFRFDRSQMLAHRDGMIPDSIGLPTLTAALVELVRREPARDDPGQEWLRATREVQVATAPLLGMIAVGDLYDLPNTLAAGRLWQRLHLLLTANGIAAQPLSQPVEMVDRERTLGREPAMASALAALIADDSDVEPGSLFLPAGAHWQPTLIFRAGYPEGNAVATPRRSLGDVLIG